MRPGTGILAGMALPGNPGNDCLFVAGTALHVGDRSTLISDNPVPAAMAGDRCVAMGHRRGNLGLGLRGPPASAVCDVRGRAGVHGLAPGAQRRAHHMEASVHAGGCDRRVAAAMGPTAADAVGGARSVGAAAAPLACPAERLAARDCAAGAGRIRVVADPRPVARPYAGVQATPAWPPAGVGTVAGDGPSAAAVRRLARPSQDGADRSLCPSRRRDSAGLDRCGVVSPVSSGAGARGAARCLLHDSAAGADFERSRGPTASTAGAVRSSRSRESIPPHLLPCSCIPGIRSPTRWTGNTASSATRSCIRSSRPTLYPAP